MPTKEELGRRLRTARFERNMTLKEVAARCGMSATHISEVERGKTSPTIGALQRISKALGENPSHFVREDNLPRVKLTRAEDRCRFYSADRDGSPISVEVLSPGLPSGCMQAYLRTVAPGERKSITPMIAEIVLLCLRGMVRVTAGSGESSVLREGDTVQLQIDDGFVSENIGEEEAEIMSFFVSPTLFTI